MAHDIDLKKLYYQGTHRGMREVDVILTPFMQQLHSLSPEELYRMESFLRENDQDILGWVMGTIKIPLMYELLLLKMRDVS